MLHCALATRGICPSSHLASLGHDICVVHLRLCAEIGTGFSTHIVVLLAVPTQLLGALEAAFGRNIVAACPDLLLNKQHATSNTLKKMNPTSFLS